MIKYCSVPWSTGAPGAETKKPRHNIITSYGNLSTSTNINTVQSDLGEEACLICGISLGMLLNVNVYKINICVVKLQPQILL